MGDLPLRTPRHRRLGGPLPRQQANVTHAHPSPESPPLAERRCLPSATCGIRPDFSGLSRWNGQVAYALLTRAPVAGGAKQASLPDAPRLACVRPVASVHPEPGSNSSLYVFCLCFFYCFHDRCAVCEPKNRRPEVSCPDRLLRLAQKLTKRLSCHAAVVAAADPFSCTTCLL